ncbi:aquaporin AQPcic-like [Limulus polyphemus]|uniref:Aquaporin AQPcic-like n=1 Tax=Limulus polyphemus TaxID=6850 RepID=A0ABM1BYM4_LIMPO|nr:aquaporin AQPcic-like [Limulus polyphemus]
MAYPSDTSLNYVTQTVNPTRPVIMGPAANPSQSDVEVMRQYIESLPQDLSYREELMSTQLWKSVKGELLGTLLLTVVGCGASLSFQPGSAASHAVTLQVSLAFGLVIASLVQWTGPVSGAHMNPSVSLALLVTRHISMLRAGLYIVAQCVGALVGAAVLYGLTPSEQRGLVSLGACEPSEHLHPSQAFGLEFLGTLVVILTILSNADPARTNSGSKALSVGLSYTAAHLLAFPYTGAGLNPARAFGPAVVAGRWRLHWVYWVGPILGGIIGGLTYEYSQVTSQSTQQLKRSFRRKSAREMMRDHSALSNNETVFTALSNDCRE